MSLQIARHAMTRVDHCLKAMRVTLIVGARQAGKSTLAKIVDENRPGGVYRSLDDPTQLQAAQADPKAFVEHDRLLTIDEIQRAPELILPIKLRVDSNNSPGQFLLTGSAQVFSLKSIPDTLPGRVATVELWPFSQSELEGTPGQLVEHLFHRSIQDLKVGTDDRQAIWCRIMRGGFPEVVQQQSENDQNLFFSNYSRDIALRGVQDISRVENPGELTAVLEILANFNGRLLVVDRVSQASGIPASTLSRYLELFELSFMIKRIPAWSNKATTRATRAKKLVFVDSGIAGYLAGFDRTFDIFNPELGHLVESFVLTELAKLASNVEDDISMFHYRTRDGIEVDGVLTQRGGRAVLVEVKASTTVAGDDFRHLRHLATRLKSNFVCGLVFYLGNDLVSLGDQMWAVPISTLWAN